MGTSDVGRAWEEQEQEDSAQARMKRRRTDFNMTGPGGSVGAVGSGFTMLSSSNRRASSKAGRSSDSRRDQGSGDFTVRFPPQTFSIRALRCFDTSGCAERARVRRGGAFYETSALDESREWRRGGKCGLLNPSVSDKLTMITFLDYGRARSAVPFSSASASMARSTPRRDSTSCTCPCSQPLPTARPRNQSKTALGNSPPPGRTLLVVLAAH